MNKCWSLFQCLYQVWFQSIFQQRCQSTLCIQLTCCDWVITVVITDYDTSQFIFQVINIAGQAQNCHNFRSNGNVKAIFSRHTICFTAQTAYDITQLTVVHIYATFPSNSTRVNTQVIALCNMVVNHSSQQVVCSADGMHIPCKVQVNIFHWYYLSITATCSTAFYTKYRP